MRRYAHGERKFNMKIMLVSVVFLIINIIGYNSKINIHQESELKVKCILSSNGTIIDKNQRIELSADLVNNNDYNLNIINCLYDSYAKLRYPKCEFNITDLNGKNVPYLWMGCGGIAKLKTSDLIILKPGEKIKLNYTDMFTALFPSGGKYKIQFEYSTNNDDISLWLGNTGPYISEFEKEQMIAFIGKIPRFTKKSNILIID